MMFESIQKEIREINTSDRMIKKFGIALFILLVLVGLYLWYREWPEWWILPSTGAVVFLLSFILPAAVRLLYYPLAIVGVILGYFISKLILILIYYTLFSMIGLFARIFRIDLLKQKIRKKESSYWVAHTKMNEDVKQYEQLY